VGPRRCHLIPLTGAICGHAAIIRIWDSVSDGVAEFGERDDLIVEGLARILGLASRRFGQG